MCGIVGMAGLLAANQEKAFADLLVIDAIRGFDSVGIMEVERYNNLVSIYKDILPAAQFIQEERFDKLVKKGFSRVLLGHNRAATRGTVIPSNAHPFSHGSIVGVHNGTLYSQHKLEDHLKFDVDSDNIFYHIDKVDAEDMWSNLHGAAALVWWDKRFSNINFLRNNDRPLFFALAEDESAIYWASEAEMLVLALTRNNIKIQEPVEVPINKMISFNIPKMKTNNAYQFKLKEPEVKELAPFVPTYSASSRSHQNSFAAWADGFSNEDRGGTYLTVGATVSFTVLGLGEESWGGKYLNCKMSEYPYFSVRVPITDIGDLRDTKAFLEKVNKVYEYSGYVSRVHYPNGDKTLLVHKDDMIPIYDKHSLAMKKAEEKEKKEEEKKVKDHGSGKMGELQFYQRYDNCGICGADLLWEDADDIEFLTYTDALCDKCSSKIEKKLLNFKEKKENKNAA